MVSRRAFLALIVAVGMALSARGASAATRNTAPTVRTRVVIEQAPSVVDASVNALVRYLSDRVTGAYRALRGARIAGDPLGGGGYRTDGIEDGPTGADPLGAKSGLGGATPAQTQRPGS